MHGLDNARVRPAAANIALQELNDFRGTRIGVALEQSDAAHNHSSRAVGALEGAGVEKGLLHGMQPAVFLQTFNGGDRLADRGAHRNLAGTARRSPHPHAPSAALPFAAAVPAAGPAKLGPKSIRQRSVQLALDRVSFAC